MTRKQNLIIPLWWLITTNKSNARRCLSSRGFAATIVPSSATFDPLIGCVCQTLCCRSSKLHTWHRTHNSLSNSRRKINSRRRWCNLELDEGGGERWPSTPSMFTVNSFSHNVCLCSGLLCQKCHFLHPGAWIVKPVSSNLALFGCRMKCDERVMPVATFDEAKSEIKRAEMFNSKTMRSSRNTVWTVEVKELLRMCLVFVAFLMIMRQEKKSSG